MNKVISGVYLGSSIVGALLVALNAGVAVLGYSVFLVSSSLGGYLAYNSNADRSLLYVNIIFGLINCLGIIRAL